MKKYELALLQHKAHNWDTAVKWIFIPTIILLVMILCGWCDGLGR